MRRKIIQWALLTVVFALIGIGLLVLLFTPPYAPGGALLTCGGIGLSALCFCAALWLGKYLDNKNLLPE